MPIPLSLIAFFAWGFVIHGWAKQWSHPARPPRLNHGTAFQVVGMTSIVLIATFAPVKIVNRQKSRHITLPKRLMTLAELAEPVEHGLNRFYYCFVSVPEGQADHAVRFLSQELTVSEFIAAIESQTRLRHRFHHCGNGSTILWGGDCSFGLHFRVPD
jgi:hypothetical protein